MKNKGISNIVIYFFLIFACVIALFPFIWSAFAATHTNTQIYSIDYAFRLGSSLAENFEKLSTAFPIWKNMMNSMFIAAVYTIGILVIDSMAGYAFAKYEFKGKSLFFGLFMMSMFIPTQVTLIPLFIEMNSFQMIDTNWSIILPGFASVFGVFLIRQNFMSFPNELIESARIDGAGHFFIFIRIVLPTMRPALTSLGILSFVNQWGNFMWPLITLHSQDKYTMPLVLSLMVQPGYVTDYGAVMVGALLALAPVLIFFLIFQKNFINGMLSGALKG
ncbi:MAG TPA: carbohydrate ABC transporter permease [Candidatus Mediterraneibacter norfolkensis]|nr:carbohydrate ABC transporter permease [Candidatus Mediterraneibacter norfolkensis]